MKWQVYSKSTGEVVDTFEAVNYPHALIMKPTRFADAEFGVRVETAEHREIERLRADLATERLLREHAEGEIRRVAAEREVQGVEIENLRAEVERLRREAVTARAAERRACINECLDEIETNDDVAQRSGAHACLRRIEARISFDGPPDPPRDEAGP